MTVPERYPPADQADSRSRLALRIVAIIPLVSVLLFTLSSWLVYNIWMRQGIYERSTSIDTLASIVRGVGSIPLPFLLFYRLRGLARRAHSAHLAEHCVIVGVGASLSLIYIGIASVILTNGDKWFGDYWIARSNTALALMAILGTLALLFILWSLYLLIRFAIAFGKAKRSLRKQWAMHDRASQ